MVLLNRHTMDLDSILIAIGLIFSGIQLYQIKEGHLMQIIQEGDRRYDQLIKDRKKIWKYYHRKDFRLQDLAKSDPDSYEEMRCQEIRYFRICFFEWSVSHFYNWVPRQTRQELGSRIRAGMTDRVHQQMWQREIKKNFSNKDFIKFIDDCIAEAQKCKNTTSG